MKTLRTFWGEGGPPCTAPPGSPVRGDIGIPNQKQSPLGREGFVVPNFKGLISRLPRLLHQQIRRNDVPVYVRQLWSNRSGDVLIRTIRLLRNQVYRVVPRGPSI